MATRHEGTVYSSSSAPAPPASVSISFSPRPSSRRHVDLEVTETEPGFKGDTATGGNKPAKLETGLTIQVPLFINEGDIIKVDTRTGTYLERSS